MPDVILPDAGAPAPAPFPVALSEGDRRVRDVLPAVVRQIPIGVAVVRRDRSVAYHNDEFARILSIEAGPDGMGVVLGPMSQPDGSAFHGGDPLDDVLSRGRPVSRRSVLIRGQDDSTVHVCVTITPIVDDGGVVGTVVYAEDQTAELEDVSQREAFVSVLSHELRTPLTSIYGGTQLLLADRMSSEVRTSVIHDIAAEAEQLHRLVEDLMAIARIERGLIRAASDPILLQRVARRAAWAEERRWPGRRVKVDAPVDLPAVRGDELYVTQVLRNLISNSVKYAPEDAPVEVTLRAHDDVVSVAVLDRGPGFPPDTGPDAFRLFYRSPSVAAHVPGTGIGLYVARALVEAQGGRIWLRNRIGGGAEVGFELPLYAIDDE